MRKIITLGIMLLFLGMTISSSAVFVNISGDNHPPYVPKNPNPENGETDVPIDEISINWEGGDPDEDDDVWYDVYLGVTNPPPLVVDHHFYHWYEPKIMDTYTTYYWQIVARDNHGETTTGPIWNFTTGSRTNKPPNPPEITADIFYKGEDFNLYFINFTLTDPDGDNLKSYAVCWEKISFAFVYKGNWPNGATIEEIKGYSRGTHQIKVECMDRSNIQGNVG